MNKLEQAARRAFETWWEREGQEFLYALNTTTDDDIKLVAEIAWKNGAYCAEQAEQEPVAHLRMGSDQRFVVTKAAEELVADTFHELYTHPVRTKDLTDDEIAMCMGKDLWNVYKNEVDFARAVIAADRRKNK